MTKEQRRELLIALAQCGVLQPAIARDLVVMASDQPGLSHPLRRWRWHRAAKRAMAWAGHPLRWSWRHLAWRPS
jgi:hypothetical protein